MSELIFIRHAETDLAGTFCGHSDPPINARGQIQVNDLIVRLGSGPFDAIYSSDLLRAVDTATALAQALAVSCATTADMREIHFGEWEGLTWTKIESRDADYTEQEAWELTQPYCALFVYAGADACQKVSQ
jgi:broad specificity phosphatase PhoE